MDFEKSDLSFDGFAGVVAGMPDQELQELLGRIQRNPKAFKKLMATHKQAPAIAAGIATSRTELQARVHQLAPEIQKGLADGSRQSVDTYLSVIKVADAVSNVKMLKDSDTKKYGVCMINGGKLEKGEPFMLTGLILLEGIGANANEDAANVSAINWGQLSSKTRNGQFEMKANGKTIIPETSLEVFINTLEKNVIGAADAYAYGYAAGGQRPGYFRLANPKMIETQVAMEFNLEYGVASTANTFFKLVLVGSRVYKY